MRKSIVFLVVGALFLVPFGAQAKTAAGNLLAANGVFEWFQKPAAVRVTRPTDMTYVSWINAAGQIQLRARDNARGAWGGVVTIDDLASSFGIEGRDDHNAPSLLALADGRIMIFYAVHDIPNNLFAKVMTAPGDVSAWSDRIRISSVEPAASFNYPQAKLLSDGTIVLFVRRGSWAGATEAILRSTDGGHSWSTPTTLIRFGQDIGIYAVIDAHGSRFDLAWSRRAGNGRPTNIYFARSLDGGVTWQKMSGQRYALPITRAASEVVYSSPDPTYVWDVTGAVAGSPRVAFVTGDGKKTRYVVSRYIGGHWRSETVTGAGLFYGRTHYYAGGIVFDPRNPDRVLVSRVSPRLELSTYTRSRWGWRHERVVTNKSGRINVRPQFVQNDPSGRIIWSAGVYDGLVNGNWTGYTRMTIRTTTLK